MFFCLCPEVNTVQKNADCHVTEKLESHLSVLDTLQKVTALSLTLETSFEQTFTKPFLLENFQFSARFVKLVLTL